MNTEFSRQRFNPWNDFSSVLQQQGRVLLDAEWNELNEIIDRRWRAETVDIIGRGTVPKQTPDGFKPIYDASAKTLSIGRGRIYVDGLLAENHGQAAAGKALDFDPALAELYGAAPLAYTDQKQFYYPNPDPLPTGPGPHLVFVDVWEREITNLERPDLVEPAVGVDTTTRLQTAWQVRVLPNPQGANLSCSTPDDQIPGWLELITPSAGRLSTAATGVPTADDPCQIPPTGGYRSLENRCYRVEIHSVDPQTGAATFKWARDNRSMTAAVTRIPAPNKIVVDRVQWDSVLRFNAGDWVEITDDWRELSGRPGILAKIAAQVEDSTRTLTLSVNLSAADFPVDAQNQPDPGRHMRIRKWDQGSDAIPVKTDGTAVLLEDGVQITFSLASLPVGPSRFRVGDYWVFAARAADASVEILTDAPPRGIHHHYCRLGFITPTGATDCRVLWPPDSGEECCACTVCVTPASHADGSMTLQQAIDRVKEAGGTVCVASGHYVIAAPLNVVGAKSLRIKGQGWQTIITYAPDPASKNLAGPALLVQDSQDFLLEDLAITVSGAPELDQPVIGLINSKEVVIEHCLLVALLMERLRILILQPKAGASGWMGIGLGGVLQNVRLGRNYIFCPIGVANWAAAAQSGIRKRLVLENTRLVTTGLLIEDNTFQCAVSAVRLQGASAHFGSSEISDNFVLGCRQGGIVITGAVDAGIYSASHFDIARNTLRVYADGIVVGVSDVRVNGNDVGSLATGDAAAKLNAGIAAIALTTGVTKAALSRCQIIGNRLTRLGGNGISLRGTVMSAMIKQNIMENLLGGGIVMESGSKAELLTIENNQLINVGTAAAPEASTPVLSAGIFLLQTDHAEISHNAIGQVGGNAGAGNLVFGILLVGCAHSKICGNRIVGIGPAATPLRIVAGIYVLGSFENLEVAGNHVRRANVPFTQIKPDNSNWFAVSVGGLATNQPLDVSHAFILRTEASHLVLGKDTAFAIADQPEMATIRGNMIEAYGIAAPVRIIVQGACVFSDNQCRHNPAGQQPVVEIAAGAIAMNSNFIQNAGLDAAGAAALPAARLVTGESSYAVLGNVSRGPIFVNNAVLGAVVPLNATIA